MNRGLLYAPEHWWRLDGFHACHRVPGEGMVVRHRTDFVHAGPSYLRSAGHGTMVMQKERTRSRSVGSGNVPSARSLNPVLPATSRSPWSLNPVLPRTSRSPRGDPE